MKNVLITGIAGLLGSQLARWIKANAPEVSVIGIDDFSNGHEENIPVRTMFIQGDVAGPTLGCIFDQYRPEYVFHFAAYAAECLSPFIRKYNYQNNLIATANVVNHCVNYGVKRLVFTSSMAVYGKGNAPFSENDQCNPVDPYGVAKLACEQDIRIAGEQHGLDYCVLRPHNVFGEGQNIWDKYRNVIGIWMRQALAGLPMTIYGTGDQVRAFSYIGNCLEPIWRAATEGKASRQTINLGGTVPMTINAMCEAVSNATSINYRSYLEGRKEVSEAWSTSEKSVDILGYKETVDIQEAISRMWIWAKAQRPREPMIFPGFEIDRGLYSYWRSA
jgi:UDP-glucose 4-epimerase